MLDALTRTHQYAHLTSSPHKTHLSTRLMSSTHTLYNAHLSARLMSPHLPDFIHSPSSHKTHLTALVHTRRSTLQCLRFCDPRWANGNPLQHEIWHPDHHQLLLLLLSTHGSSKCVRPTLSLTHTPPCNAAWETETVEDS